MKLSMGGTIVKENKLQRMWPTDASMEAQVTVMCANSRTHTG